MTVASEKFNFVIDVKSPFPVYEQVKEKLRFMIAAGTLLPGERLMPIRELARMLGINHNTIVKVYYQLDVEGYIHSKAGRGFFVNELTDQEKLNDKERFMSRAVEEFIAKAMELGFQTEEILEEVKKVCGSKVSEPSGSLD